MLGNSKSRRSWESGAPSSSEAVGRHLQEEEIYLQYIAVAAMSVCVFTCESISAVNRAPGPRSLVPFKFSLCKFIA